ncbi:MAG: hemerythrin domain-containing protein [Candidatus Bathyarchaeia archaeon]|jgi:hemerythrin superfamily protein
MENPLQREMEKEQQELERNATIYDILKLEHNDIKKLFKQMIENESFQEETFSDIKKALTLHMDGEEKILYPLLKKSDDTRLITIESYEEHDLAKKVINDIDNASASDGETKFARAKVLSEVVNQHVKEEEDELFKKAKKVFTKEEEQRMAKQFMDEKMAKM